MGQLLRKTVRSIVSNNDGIMKNILLHYLRCLTYYWAIGHPRLQGEPTPLLRLPNDKLQVREGARLRAFGLSPNLPRAPSRQLEALVRFLHKCMIATIFK